MGVLLENRGARAIAQEAAPKEAIFNPFLLCSLFTCQGAWNGVLQVSQTQSSQQPGSPHFLAPHAISYNTPLTKPAIAQIAQRENAQY